jgi:hypothetical protein
MSGSHARLFGLAFLAGLAMLLPLRADDYLDQKKRELALEAQKTVADVQTALETSRQLEKKDPAAAKALLDKRLLEVSDSVTLDDKTRNELRSKLKARLDQVEATAREQKAVADSKSKRDADRIAAEERERMEKAKLYGQGKSVTDTAKDRIDTTKKNLDTSGSLKDTREKNIVDMRLADEKLYAQMGKEQRITQHFIDISEKRKQKLTAKEVALLKALNSTITVEFNKDSLKSVLEFLSERVPDVTIYLDEASLKDVGIEDYSDAKVTFRKNKVTVRTLLKKAFADLGLTYVIKDGAINVITPDRMKDYLVTRTYPVGDLVGPFDNLRYSPNAQKAIAYQQAQQLIQMIVTQIEPQSWQGVSERGYGTIYYDEVTRSLVVRHTAEMHYMLGGGLK